MFARRFALRPRAAFCALGALAWAAAPARAGLFDALAEWQRPNLHYHELALEPYYAFTQLYESNIYRAPAGGSPGVQSSWISQSDAGLKASLPLSALHRLDLDYDFTWRGYSRQPRVNDAVIQAAGGGWTYRRPDGLGASVRDDYLNTVDPPSSELTAREKRWQNILGAQADYAAQGGRFAARLDAQHAAYKYVSDDLDLRRLLDRYEELAGGRLGWRLQPKTLAYLAYHRQVIHYTVHQAAPTKDSRSHIFDLGLQGQLSPKVRGKLETGLTNRAYDEAVLPGGGKVRDVWHVDAALTYRPLERTDVELTAFRRLEESVFTLNDFYVASGGGAAVSHRLPGRVTLAVLGNVQSNKYQHEATVGGLTAVRRDDIYEAGLSAEYDVREWLKARASYLYRARFSRFSADFDYRDHLAALSLSLSL